MPRLRNGPPLLAREQDAELVSSTSSSSSPLSLQDLLSQFLPPSSSPINSPSISSSLVVEPLLRIASDEGGGGGVDGGMGRTGETVLAVLLPLLIVLSTLLFLILVFLICVLIMKKKRGIRYVRSGVTEQEEGRRPRSLAFAGSERDEMSSI